MLSLKTIGKRNNQTTMTLRGEQVTVQGLSMSDRNTIDCLFPSPLAPMGKPPTRGDLAAEEPLYDDPEYRKATIERVSRVVVIEVAIGLDWETAAGERWKQVRDDGHKARAWCTAASEELVESGFSATEVDLVLDVIGKVERGVVPAGKE